MVSLIVLWFFTLSQDIDISEKSSWKLHIPIVKLREGVEFVNETFENALDEGPPIRLQRFARANETKIGDYVYMNNPFTGYVEGTCGPHAWLRVPIDDLCEPRQEWIRTRWNYLGQESSLQIVDGTCGSAMWNDQGMVIGFFRYAPTSGRFLDWCVTVSAEHIIDNGWSIV